MELFEARELLEPLVRPDDRKWVDAGAGDGLFTAALASLLPPECRIDAFDLDIRRLENLGRKLSPDSFPGRVRIFRSELTAWASSLGSPDLSGVFFGNVLHFLPPADQRATLASAASALEATGRIVVLEYANRRASRWTPYPIGADDLLGMLRECGLFDAEVVRRKPSRFGGELYLAVGRR